VSPPELLIEGSGVSPPDSCLLNSPEPLLNSCIVVWFRGLEWPVLKNAICFGSPTEADGGGATYYFDPDSGTAYHRAGYW
jgi:hypothetical protein